MISLRYHALVYLKVHAGSPPADVLVDPFGSALLYTLYNIYMVSSYIFDFLPPETFVQWYCKLSRPKEVLNY